MGYYGRRRWNSYHSDDFFKMMKFKPILSDLRKYFFELDSFMLNAMFLEYKSEYGESAYKYALKAYPKWKNGSTYLSSKSMFRLIKTLPHYLNENQRINLLEKLLDNYSVSYYNSESFEATWDNYWRCIQDVANKIRYESSKLYKNVEIPKELIEEVSWISDDDMVWATKIYNQYLFNKHKEKATDALRSLNLFRETCERMKFQEAIYDDDLHVDLDVLTVRYYLTVQHKERSISQSIGHFFGFCK